MDASTSSLAIQTRVIRGPSTTAVRRGLSFLSIPIEINLTSFGPTGYLGMDSGRTNAKQGPILIGEILPNDAVFVDIQWCFSTHALTPKAEQIRQYFQDHAEAPIHIRFLKQIGAVISSNSWQNELKEYFDVFLEVLSRWTSIRLWAPYVPRQSFVGRVFSEAPLLEHVILEGPPSFDIPMVCHLLSSCWNGAHSLKTFELISKAENSIGSMMVNPRNYLPLENITQIQLCTKLSIFECSEVLYRAPNLVECLFSNITSSDTVLCPIRCKHLQKLKLVANPEDFKSGTSINLGTLFESFRAPKLKHLKMANNSHWEEDHLSFTTFLHRSRCSLQALELDQIKMTGSQLRSILLLTPSLRILKVHGTPLHNPQPFTPNLMRSLTKDLQNPVVLYLCPRLEMLSINETVVRSLPDGMVANMLLGRLSDLKMFRFKLDEQPSPHNIKIAKLMGVVMERRNLRVLDEGSPASAREWDEYIRQNLVVSDLKSKDTDFLHPVN